MDEKDSRPLARGPYRKSELTRRRILDAAMEVFAIRGYRGSSLREIADLCGMDQSSIFHHFPGKEALLLAVMEERDRRADVLLEAAADAEPLEALLELARHNAAQPGVVELYTVLAAESLTPEHPLAEYFRERTHRVRAGFRRGLTDAAARGLLRDDVDPVLAADSMFALWDGLQLHWLIAGDETDVVEVLRHFLEMLRAPAPDRLPCSGAPTTTDDDDRDRDNH